MNSRLKLQPDARKGVGRTRHQTLECYPSTQSGGLRSDRVALPVLHLSNAEENDNQTAHLSHKIRVDGENQTQNTTKPWANAVDNHDEMILPHIVIKPNISPPQKLSSLLRARKTWNGTLRPQGDTLETRHNLQRRASCTNTSLATFEATEMILLAEIDSDVRCTIFLRQRAPRETLASYPDDSDSRQSQIRYKLRALDRKIKMNKEKLAQVRERIAELGGNSDLLSIPGGPEQQKCITEQPDCLEDKPLSPALHARREAKEITSALPSKITIASAVLVIQCSIRAFRARRCLADLLAKTYQRVLNPSSNQYFYYNRITRSSQWEAPRLMHRCHCSLDAQPKPARVIISDPVLNAAAKTIQTMYRQRALRLFLKDLQLGNLEKVFDTGFGAWYYFNSRTNHSFWENVHHVRLTASNSAIYNRHQP